MYFSLLVFARRTQEYSSRVGSREKFEHFERRESDGKQAGAHGPRAGARHATNLPAHAHLFQYLGYRKMFLVFTRNAEAHSQCSNVGQSFISAAFEDQIFERKLKPQIDGFNFLVLFRQRFPTTKESRKARLPGPGNWSCRRSDRRRHIIRRIRSISGRNCGRGNSSGGGNSDVRFFPRRTATKNLRKTRFSSLDGNCSLRRANARRHFGRRFGTRSGRFPSCVSTKICAASMLNSSALSTRRLLRQGGARVTGRRGEKSMSSTSFRG